MNRSMPGVVYAPVDLAPEALPALYEFATSHRQVAAINHTEPHKGNPELNRLIVQTDERPPVTDFILKDSLGRWHPFNINGKAFINYVNEDVDPLVGKTVVLFGAGGTGEPLARELSRFVSELCLVDLVDKGALAEELSVHCPTSACRFWKERLHDEVKDLIVVNAAGKTAWDGPSPGTGVRDLLKQFSKRNFVYIDLFPFSELPIIEEATHLGWRAFHTQGMQVRNDYMIVQLLAEQLHFASPSYDAFRAEVQRADRELTLTRST